MSNHHYHLQKHSDIGPTVNHQKGQKAAVFKDNYANDGQVFKSRDAVLRIAILNLANNYLNYPFTECPDKPKEHGSLFRKNMCRGNGILLL
jgi:hypothetical protein